MKRLLFLTLSVIVGLHTQTGNAMLGHARRFIAPRTAMMMNHLAKQPKNSLFAALPYQAKAFSSQAASSPLFKKMRDYAPKIIGAGLAGAALATQIADCYVSVTEFLQNPETGHIVILLPDSHIVVKSINCDDIITSNDGKVTLPINKAHYQLVQQQQKELLALLSTLQNKQTSVHVLVEDPNYQTLNSPHIDDYLAKIKSFHVIPGICPCDNSLKEIAHSPLILFKKLCEEKNIPCTNIEFREEQHSQKIAHLEKIFNETPLDQIKKIFFYYGIYLTAESLSVNNLLNAGIDMTILHHIKNISMQDPKTTNVVLAGRRHTDSVAKVLHQCMGYTKRHIITPNNSSSWQGGAHLTDNMVTRPQRFWLQLRKELMDIDNEEYHRSITLSSQPYLRFKPLSDIATKVLAGLEELDK